MLRLRRLKIEKFRSLQPGTELLFNDGFNVLLGQNGTGKTTLLELLSAILRTDFEQFDQEEFELEYELESAPSERLLIQLFSRRIPRSKPAGIQGGVGHALAVVLGGNNQPEATSVKRTFSISGTSQRFPDGVKLSVQEDDILRFHAGAIKEERRINLAEEPWPGGLTTFQVFLWALTTSSSISLPDGTDGRWPYAAGPAMAGYMLASPLIERSAVRFDESLSYFDKLLGRQASFELVHWKDHWLPLKSTLPAWKLIAPLLKPDLEGEPTSDSQQPGVLAQLVQLMGFYRAELHFSRLAQQRLAEDQVLVHFGNPTVQFSYSNDDMISQGSLSYGQKRLLSFYLYLAANGSCVIADELVNGLHHQWIRACLDAIGDRQAFLTSQNPLLLDYLPFTSDEQVRRSFILCSSEPREDRRRFTWRNMTLEDAAEFFSAYQIGVEHVSEILQSRGLW